MQISWSDLQAHPYTRYHPAGYQRLECGGTRLSLDAALAKVGMGLDEMGRFNFGINEDYEACLVNGASQMMWERDSSGVPGVSGWLGSWFWVPGDVVLATPDPDGAVLKNKVAPQKDPSTVFTFENVSGFDTEVEIVKPGAPVKGYAARTHKDGPWAASTVDRGIEAGDLLFNHHAGDDFISRITVSWPTHAGIALTEEVAADADARADGEAVQFITMDEFFYQGDQHYHTTPNGGLIYRYIGAKGDSAETVNTVRYEAAEWAKGQTANKWKFSLENSPIIAEERENGLVTKVYDGKKKRALRIVNKDFDKQGKAVDDKGQRSTFYSRSAGDFKETELHTIYCAELVWRAYRAAGVNVVDPKKFENLFEHSNRGVAGVLWWKIMHDRAGADFGRDGDDNAITDTGNMLRRQLRTWRRLPNAVLRKKVLAYMKKKFSGYLCAPYQLATSELTERVAQLPAADPEHEKIDLPNFRHKNINPYDVVVVLCKGSSDQEFDEAWDAFVEAKGEVTSLSLDKIWYGSEGDDPAAVLWSEDEPYNSPVDFSAAGEKPPHA
jgi:hypothetical protein